MPTPDAILDMTDTDAHPSPAELARTYGRQVFDAAYRVLGEAAAAEDVQQDVFLRLVESPPRDVVSWPALLAASAVRLAIDRLRHRRRWRRWFALFGRDDAIVPASTGPDQNATQHERARQLRVAISALPAREAQCFALRWIEGLELAEIARATGLRENTISVALHRAARHLEHRLAEAAATTEPTP